MISILIPTYNQTCVSLVETMWQQANALSIAFEILVADDGSNKETIATNSKIDSLDHCRHIVVSKNIGPAKLRNLLANNAQYDFLLFMDSDTMPTHDHFLQKYLDNKVENGVVCGGLAYDKTKKNSMCRLRYVYGTKVETMPAHKRNKQPYDKFMSGCFLAGKQVFASVRFDDNMRLGYEDTWFGTLLQNAGITISHIDNPVYHNSADNADDYLRKTKVAIQNLAAYKEKMSTHIRLLRWYDKMQRCHLTTAIGRIFGKTEPLLMKNLTGKHPSLHLFAFYKLGCLCTFLGKKSG